MKILIDARFLGTPTGIGRYVESLVLELEKQSLDPLRPPRLGEAGQSASEASQVKDINFVILLSPDGFNKWDSSNARFRKKLVYARWYTLREQFALLKVLREENPDLAHFPHWNICYFWKKPFVVTIHDLILLDYPTRRASKLGAITYWIKYKILFPIVLHKAICGSSKIIVPSNYTKQSILKYFSKVDPKKIEVIYEGAHLENPKSEINSKSFSFAKALDDKQIPKSKFLLYVGNALPHKNLEFLIRVFKRLKDNLSLRDLKLVFVGENTYFYERIKDYVKKLGLKKEVIFTGKINDDGLSDFYRNSEVYVFPSLLEGFGLPPLEAMTHGAPVVASNSSCLPEILSDAAVYFDPCNENEAVEVIKKILFDESLRENLRQKGFNQAQKYSWQDNAEATHNIYLNCV